MKQLIVAFHGGRSSGKNTSTNFLVGYLICQKRRRLDKLGIKSSLPKMFTIDNGGKLIVEGEFYDANNKPTIQQAELDINRRDTEFLDYAYLNIWPCAKSFSFADSLKEMCMRLFGLSYEQCYGTDDEKNTPTVVKWDDMLYFFSYNERRELKDKKGKIMTGREVMQYFGTNICRKLYNDCWVNDCMGKIINEGWEFNIISDCRFKNEVEVIQKFGGKVIHFTRKPFEDSHISENDAVEDEKFDIVIDNRELSIQDQNQQVLDYLYSVGFLEGYIGVE